MAGLFAIKIIAVVLSVLSLSGATFGAANITFADDSIRTCQDDVGSVALVARQILLHPYKAATHLSHEQRQPLPQPSAIFCHTYRGPPFSLSFAWLVEAGSAWTDKACCP
jgi:hypothetical protein